MITHLMATPPESMAVLPGDAKGSESRRCRTHLVKPLLERKPGALRNGLPFKGWLLPAPIERVRKKLLKQPKGDRTFVDILLAMREHGSEILTVACELTL